MVDRQTTLTGTGAAFEFTTFRSRQSFTDLFEDAIRLYCITYCESPELLLELFDDYDLDELEVIVGDVDDYRERLIDKPDVADRLEQLKEAGKLRIYLCPTKTVHSKLYEIEHADGTITLLCGSPNLTKTAWRNQTNAGIVFRTDPGSEVHDRFRAMYDEHKASYAELFLDDLTEEIETADEERRAVVERWVEGRTAEKSELEELHGTLTEKMVTASDETDDAQVAVDGAAAVEDDETAELEAQGRDADDSASEQEMVVSLQGFSEKGKERAEEAFGDFGTVSSDELRITPSGYGRQLKTVYGVPKMYVDEEQRQLTLTAGGGQTRIGTAPPDDPAAINDALAHLEAYFDTVDKYAQTNRPLAMKTHMFEALLYLFWAPFANRYAEHLWRNNLQLDKRLPYLFLFGESNSGKGTFIKFALNLLSDGQVTGALDADDFGKRRVRAIRRLDTCFPLVVDDIKKSKIRQTDTLRNYWSDWNPERNYPALVFVSNDTKPDEWFRNRAKLIHFDGQFASDIEGEAEVNRLIDRPNPVFHWFTHMYLDRGRDLRNDALAEARAIVVELYDRASRDLPAYFPDKPAEEIYDMGRKRWQQAHADEKFTIREEDERLHIDFADEMESYEILRFRRDLPNQVRAEKYGRELVIKTPTPFREWLQEGETGDDASTTGRIGPLARIRELFG